MQIINSTLCTSLLLALSLAAVGQPTRAVIPPSEKGQEQTIRSIPLPPMPGEEPHATYCPMKIGKIPHRDKPLKVDYSRKPGAGRVPSGEQIIREACVPEIIGCHDTETCSAPSASICPPPPPPPPRIICSDLFRAIEEMPRFPGCESLPTIAEKKQCASEKMFEFIYENLNYPEAARKNGIEGPVVIQFVVEKDGSVTSARIVRDIGGGCGEEALRVVELMNQAGLKWIPGKQAGRQVRTQFNIPVKFMPGDAAKFCPSPPVEEACSVEEKMHAKEPEPQNEIRQMLCNVSLPPPPPCGGIYPPTPPLDEELFKIVEQMPRFPGCEEMVSPEEKRQCSEEKLLEFLDENLTYPPLARENCVEGTVVIQFVVEKDGSVTNATIVRDIGAHCGEAALNVVNLMNERNLKWIPGRQRGRAVRVQLSLPVRFRIDCSDTEPTPVAEAPLSGPAGREEHKEQADEALHPSEATPSGTPLTFGPEGFRLFPNPAAEWLNVHFQPAPGRVSLVVVNTVGQVLWKKEYAHTDGILEERVNLTLWPPGPYFLRIEQQGKKQTHPFVRQR